MVKFVEENTSAKLDMDKLKEAIRNSDRAGVYWKKIMELRKHKPSPCSFRGLAGQILPLVTALGDKDAADFYMAYYQHYENQMKEGFTPTEGGEKYRLIYNGIPIWHHLQFIDYFEKKGANFVWEPYTSLSWGNKTPSGRLDPENPIRTLAEKYTNNNSNKPIKKRFEYFEKAIEEYDVDGVVMFSNRSCRPQSIGQDETIQMVRDKYKLPVLVFEGDQADAEGFNWQDATNKIDGFIEVLEGTKH
jgi:benzoyl-CoA reductase/2-hydroxyglutaryl-CoA dehydratase subunit BcrC/BadD/HgdB